MEGMMKTKLRQRRLQIPTRMPTRCQRSQRGRRDGIQSCSHHKFNMTNKAKTFKWQKQRLIDKKNLIVKFVKKKKQKSRSKKIWISHTTNKESAKQKGHNKSFANPYPLNPKTHSYHSNTVQSKNKS